MTEEQVSVEAAPAAQESAPSSDRDSILAGMAELKNEPTPDGEVDLTQTSEPDEAAVEAKDEDAEEVEEVAEQEADPEVEAAPDAMDADLEKIQQAEKRSKERLADHMQSERATFAAEREEHAALLAEAQAIKADHAAAQRRAFDAKGKSHAELMAEARRLHALAVSSDPDADPAQKATAQRTVKESAMEERLAAAEKRADAADERWNARENEVTQKAQAKEMTDHLVGAITDETPLTRNILNGKGAAEAKSRMLNIAIALYQQTGETPDAVDVHKYFEEAERGRLSDMGLDPDLILKSSQATTKTKTPVAGEKTSAPTLGNDLTTSTQPRGAPMTEAEEREDILKGMSQL